MISIDKTAILILTCNDFEAMEITLNQVIRTTPRSVPIYLLSNCAGMHGANICERICQIASNIQHGRIRWINPGRARPAYYGIEEAIREHIAEEYILKLDDDVFPITNGWLENLIDCYKRHDDGNLAYVSGIVNNNPWGFSRLIQLPELKAAYDDMMPHAHIGGTYIAGYQDYRINAPGTVDAGGWGTVWQFPQLARWIHENTTLVPEKYIELTKNLPEEQFDASVRYSINVMLFQRDLWKKFGNGGNDDEEMLNKYCMNNGNKIYIRADTPFVHLYFGPQKAFLVDLIQKIREVYRPLDQLGGAELVNDWNTFREYWFQDQKLKKN